MTPGPAGLGESSGAAAPPRLVPGSGVRETEAVGLLRTVWDQEAASRTGRSPESGSPAVGGLLRSVSSNKLLLGARSGHADNSCDFHKRG